MRPKLSIIMVTFNSARYIRDAIFSLVDQPFSDWELLVCDGCSTDRTGEIVESFGDARIRLFVEPDLGMYHARNKGLLRARGEYIGFLNSDDAYIPKTLDLVAQRISEKGQDVHVFNMEQILSDGGVLDYPYWNKPHKLRVRMDLFIPDQSTFIRRECLSQLGLYDLKYRIVGDWDFWQRAILEGLSFDYFDLVIARFYFRDDSLTFNKSLRRARFREKCSLYYKHNGALNLRRYMGYMYRLIVEETKAIL